MMKRYLTAAAAVVLAVSLGILLARVPWEIPEPQPAAESQSQEDTREAGLPAEESKPESESSPASTPSEASREEAPAEPSEQPSAGYYIRDWNGRVCIIRDGEETPEMIFDIYTRLLPEYDQQQLQKGLYVESYEELTAMIEDYIS